MDLPALGTRARDATATAIRGFARSLRSPRNVAVLVLSLGVLGLGAAVLPALVPELPEGWNREGDGRALAQRIADKPDPIALLAISPEPLSAPMALDPVTGGPRYGAAFSAGPEAGEPQAGGPGGRATRQSAVFQVATPTPPATAERMGDLHLLTGWGRGPAGQPAPEIGMARRYAIDRIVAPETARDTIKRAVFPKWSGVMEKSYAWDAEFDGACSDIVGKPCGLQLWQSMLQQISHESPLVQLDQVNRLMNQVRYREDSDAWGIADYWATPGEFFAYGGDCEDYAVAKYYSLRALGFAAERMRIVVLEDVRLDRIHAVLVVTLGEQELMLDNQYRSLVDWKSADDYRPFYSVNEETFEVHEALTARRRAT